MNIKLCKVQASTDDGYWRESSSFWMKMFIRTKKELEVYKNRERKRQETPNLRIIPKTTEANFKNK